MGLDPYTAASFAAALFVTIAAFRYIGDPDAPWWWLCPFLAGLAALNLFLALV